MDKTRTKFTPAHLWRDVLQLPDFGTFYDISRLPAILEGRKTYHFGLLYDITRRTEASCV